MYSAFGNNSFRKAMGNKKDHGDEGSFAPARAPKISKTFVVFSLRQHRCVELFHVGADAPPLSYQLETMK